MSDMSHSQWPRLIARTSGGAALLIGVIVLLGWTFQVAALKSVLPGLPKMVPATAMLLAVAGIALWCLTRDSSESSHQQLSATGHLRFISPAHICAVFVLCLGALRLAAYIFHRNVSFDLLGFAEAASDSSPGRMAPATALNFILLGIALLLASTSRFPRLFQLFVLLAGLVGWLGFSHYLYGGEPLLLYAQMAPHTALTFLILSIGVLNTRANLGLVALLASDTAGGAVARRLVPSALLAPLLLGWLRLLGQREGWYGMEAGTTLLVLGNVLVFGGIIWASAAGLHRTDTARSRAEELLRRQASLFDQTYDAVLVWEWNGPITFWNQAAERSYGFSRKEALGNSSHTLLRTSTRAGLESVLNSLEQDGYWEGELEHTRRDGKRILVESRMVRVSEGRDTYVLETDRDIGERRLLEEQLRQSQKMEGIGRLAGGVAHDFNNLLGVILACAELLAQTAEQNKIRSLTEEIRKAGERAASLTRQLLAFSRKQILEPRVLDLNVVLADMSKMLLRLVGEDVQFKTVLQPDLWRVSVDPGQIEQILLNLVVNARQAMPAGGKLTLESQNVDLDETYARTHDSVMPGQYVMIAVADSGIGMTPETQARVFEPFFTTKPDGTGLGLATVYGAVKQSGGSIWLYSEPGKGTTFKLYFPRVFEPSDCSEGQGPAPDLSHEAATVLLVEDFYSLREVAREFLEEAGYAVLSAASGGDALRLAAQHKGPIHLLLTDVIMPQMSGPELAKEVVRTHPETRVLFMSGYTADAIVHHGVLDKGIALLAKPFTCSALTRKVRDVLNT